MSSTPALKGPFHTILFKVSGFRPKKYRTCTEPGRGDLDNREEETQATEIAHEKGQVSDATEEISKWASSNGVGGHARSIASEGGSISGDTDGTTPGAGQGHK